MNEAVGTKTTLWDVADHLDSKEAILGYIEAVLEVGDPALIAAAQSDVERAKWKGPRIDFETFVAQLAERRVALGKEIEMPRNSGTRRTESKKALLKAIEDAGGKW